jgi:hypothetical protein
MTRIDSRRARVTSVFSYAQETLALLAMFINWLGRQGLNLGKAEGAEDDMRVSELSTGGVAYGTLAKVFS